MYACVSNLIAKCIGGLFVENHCLNVLFTLEK
jgi:hypothetical protein